MNQLIIHGARGSFPVSGSRYRRYGGNTPCISVETESGILILDAGSGMGHLAESLRRRRQLPSFTILFTHFHLDHVIGLPAFWPFYESRASVTLMADSRQFPDWQTHLKKLFDAPHWPANPLKARARVRFQPFPTGSGGAKIQGIQVHHRPVQHPQGGISYRLETPTGTVVLATDREEESAAQEREFARFCTGADLLIHDAQYTPRECAKRRGWGHSTWKTATEIATQAKVRRLVLTSHNPTHSDAEIDAVVSSARRLFRSTEAAYEGMTFSLLNQGKGRPHGR